jgi:hypothetical protein
MLKVQKDRSLTGFHMTFENGWTVSVQMGRNNYCANGDSRSALMLMGAPDSCSNAEVAAWDENNNWHQFSDNPFDTVKGWLTADEVADFIETIRKLPRE